VLSINGAVNRAVISLWFKAFERNIPDVTNSLYRINTRDLHTSVFLLSQKPRADIIMSPAMDLQFKLRTMALRWLIQSPRTLKATPSDLRIGVITVLALPTSQFLPRSIPTSGRD